MFVPSAVHANSFPSFIFPRRFSSPATRAIDPLTLITGSDITTESSEKGIKRNCLPGIEHGLPADRDFLTRLMQGGDVIVGRACCRYPPDRARGERLVEVIVGYT